MRIWKRQAKAARSRAMRQVWRSGALRAGLGLLLSLLLGGCGSMSYSGGVTTVVAVPTVTPKVPVPLRTDGTPIPLGARTLLGKSLEEIGSRAQQDAVLSRHSTAGTPEVALVRFVKSHDLVDLGLGCIFDYGVIEEPPYALVILKGTFQPQLGGAVVVKPPISPYLAYVYDVWLGEITLIDASSNAGHFKKALNDPTMPDPNMSNGRICPPYQGPKHHYGSIAPLPPTQLTTPLPYVPPPTHQPGPVPTEVQPITNPSP